MGALLMIYDDLTEEESVRWERNGWVPSRVIPGSPPNMWRHDVFHWMGTIRVRKIESEIDRRVEEAVLPLREALQAFYVGDAEYEGLRREDAVGGNVDCFTRALIDANRLLREYPGCGTPKETP